MLISEMNGRECRDLLDRLSFGRLACTRDNQPYIVPIYFSYESDRLYGFATFGRKIEWMRLNPRVCIEADEVLSHFEWASVIIFGRYEEFPDTPEYSAARMQAQSMLEKRSLWWQTGFAANQRRSQPHSAPGVLYCIHIDEVTGYRASPDPAEKAAGFTRPPHGTKLR